MLETLMYPASTHGGENLAVETISRKEAIAWLAGIIDGEGCIYAFWAKQQPYMKGPGMRINVLIGGCHPAMLAKVTKVLCACNIGFCYQVAQRKAGNKRKTALSVVIAGKTRVKKLLELVIPHLTEKLRQAELALELINYREGLTDTFGPDRKNKKALWEDQKIVDLIREIKILKNVFPDILSFSRSPSKEFGCQSSETLRRQLHGNEVMIKSELHGDMQTVAEMMAG